MGHTVRLDYSDFFQGAEVTPYYDPLLIKCTCSGRTPEAVIKKAISALREVRVDGVETNVWFLIRVLLTPEFLGGSCWTTFIDDYPHLRSLSRPDQRASKFLNFLADAAVNGSRIEGQAVSLSIEIRSFLE